MPYAIVKCEAAKLASGVTFYCASGTASTSENEIMYHLNRSLPMSCFSTVEKDGFYSVSRPACWVLDSLESLGYKTCGQPVLHGSVFVWVMHRD